MRSTLSRSPVHADVFSHLPVLLMRALDTDETAALVDDLLAAGWRPGQLRHRVGAEPAALDLAGVGGIGRLDREHADALAPPPASPEVRAAAIAQIRSGLKGAPRRRPEPVPRTRPACSLCAGEGRYFVTRDVHLCARCVEVMATGRARISRTG